MRLLWLFLILAVLVLVPFAIWGDAFDALFEYEKVKAWFDDLGVSWAWLVGIGLLVSDLFLPVLGTVVMSSLGYLYGFWLGGFLAASGSMLAGLLAYGLCRSLGRGVAERIAGVDDLAKGERLFNGQAGGWMVALSRWLPVMPEVIACLAGMLMTSSMIRPNSPAGTPAFLTRVIGCWLKPNAGWQTKTAPILWVSLSPKMVQHIRCVRVGCC